MSHQHFHRSMPHSSRSHDLRQQARIAELSAASLLWIGSNAPVYRSQEQLQQALTIKCVPAAVWIGLQHLRQACLRLRCFILRTASSLRIKIDIAALTHQVLCVFTASSSSIQ